jgi:formylglycine-generating enzyme required for sulfatase activity
MGGLNGKCGDRHVVMDTPFYLGAHPVTQGQWKQVMGKNPSWFQRGASGASVVDNEKLGRIPEADLDLFPVESVSWDEVQEFIRKLNAMEQQEGGWHYNLPAEEQWEYAVRSPVPSGAGAAQAHCGFSFYTPQPTNSLTDKDAIFASRLQRPCKVGTFPPNGLGIFDLHGSVWELTQTGASAARGMRGGSWWYFSMYCTAAYRGTHWGVFRKNDVGFRLARVMA